MQIGLKFLYKTVRKRTDHREGKWQDCASRDPAIQIFPHARRVTPKGLFMSSNGRQILLVEDDRGIQGLIYVLFSRKEIKVDCASDGEQALVMLRAKEYGAVLLDLMLPRVNGFEVMRELKAL